MSDPLSVFITNTTDANFKTQKARYDAVLNSAIASRVKAKKTATTIYLYDKTGKETSSVVHKYEIHDIVVADDVKINAAGNVSSPSVDPLTVVLECRYKTQLYDKGSKVSAGYGLSFPAVGSTILEPEYYSRYRFSSPVNYGNIVHWSDTSTAATYFSEAYNVNMWEWYQPSIISDIAQSLASAPYKVFTGLTTGKKYAMIYSGLVAYDVVVNQGWVSGRSAGSVIIFYELTDAEWASGKV